MLARPLDLEVGCRILWSRGLRANACVAGCERAVRQARPIAPDRGIEALGTAWVDVVVDAIDPLHIGAEARLPGKVERDVHAEAAGLGHRIDQPLEWILPAEGVVIPLRIKLAGCHPCRVAFDRFRHRWRAQARAVDEHAAGDGLGAFDLELEAAIAYPG